MRSARSAARTCGALASASEYTATGRMPNCRQARMIRSAISPRLATRTVPNRSDLALPRGGRRCPGRPAVDARDLCLPDPPGAPGLGRPSTLDHERRRPHELRLEDVVGADP